MPKYGLSEILYGKMKTYNLITAEQIARLEAQSCRCEDWNNVLVDPEFDTECIVLI